MIWWQDLPGPTGRAQHAPPDQYPFWGMTKYRVDRVGRVDRILPALTRDRS